MLSPHCTTNIEFKKINCEASKSISSSQTDNSTVTITQMTAFTSLLDPVANPETNAGVEITDDGQRNHQSFKSKSRPKFTIGDLEEGTVEFPITTSSTEVPDKPEREALEILNTAAVRLRRDAINDKESHRCGGRRWSLTSAMTDEKISDAGLVKVLDSMREDTNQKEEDGIVSLDALDVEKVVLEGWGTGVSDAGGDGSKSKVRKILHDTGHSTLRESPTHEYAFYPFQFEASSSANVDPVHRGGHPKTAKQHIRSRSVPSHAWLDAQRALLVCRELILTERHYIVQLSTLVQQQTATPPPPLMCDCAKDLLRVCERVLKEMEQDPSARGVSRAFLEGEEEIQGAYIGWCGVVGGWFSDDGESQNGIVPVGRSSLDLFEGVRRRKMRSRVGSRTDTDRQISPVKGPEEDDPSTTPLKRTVSTWRKSMPALAFDTPLLYGDRKKDKESEWQATPSDRKVTVRNLAILPTQRVMRYAMIYQGNFFVIGL